MKRTLLIAVLAITGTLMAGQGMQRPSFADLDRNGDGKISRQEFEQTRQERMKKMAEAGRMMRHAGDAPQFSDIDTNHDGYLERNEFQKHRQQCRQRRGRGMGMGRNRY